MFFKLSLVTRFCGGGSASLREVLSLPFELLRERLGDLLRLVLVWLREVSTGLKRDVLKLFLSVFFKLKAYLSVVLVLRAFYAAANFDSYSVTLSISSFRRSFSMRRCI